MRIEIMAKLPEAKSVKLIVNACQYVYLQKRKKKTNTLASVYENWLNFVLNSDSVTIVTTELCFRFCLCK